MPLEASSSACSRRKARQLESKYSSAARAAVSCFLSPDSCLLSPVPCLLKKLAVAALRIRHVHLAGPGVFRRRAAAAAIRNPLAAGAAGHLVHRDFAPRAHFLQQRMVLPDFAERRFADGAQRGRRQHVARHDHAVVVHRQLREHAAAGRQTPHFPAPGLAPGGLGFFHLPEHVPQGQRTRRGLDAAGILLLEPDQRAHRLRPLLRQQHDVLPPRAAGAHRHRVVRADPRQADLVQQQPERGFQIADVVPVDRHAGRRRNARRLQQPQPADGPVETPFAARGVVDVRPRAVDGYLDHVQPPPPMRLAQLRQDVFRQERPVRQDREAHARRDDPVEQFPKIRPQEQFAAAERQAAHGQAAQFAEKVQPALRRQVAAPDHFVGVEAVGAAQVAPAGQGQIQRARRFAQPGPVLRRQRRRARRGRRRGESVAEQFFRERAGVGRQVVRRRGVIAPGQRRGEVFRPGRAVHGRPDGGAGAVDDFFTGAVGIEQDEVVPLAAGGNRRFPAPENRRGLPRRHAGAE